MKKKKKILHISFGGLGHGGVSAVIFSIVEPLRDEFNFGCVVFRTKGESEARFTSLGQLHRIPCYLKNGKRSVFEMLTRPLRLFFGVYHICKKYGYDVVHAHNGEDEGVCLLAAKCAGVAYRIAHAHNTNTPRKMPFYKRLADRINRSLLRKHATQRVGCSRQACRDFFGSETGTVIPNAVNLSRFDIEQRQEHGDVTFIHVGRYCYQKNQAFVIRVFEEIHREMPNARLLLVGFGTEQEQLRRQIEEAGLSSSVELVPGDKVKVEDYYAKSDIMIFPSRYEGFGIVLIEAQAMGIHCFVSEAVQPEANVGLLTFLSLTQSPREWAEQILNYLREARPVNYKGLEKSLSRYSLEAISKQYRELYGKEKTSD